MINGLGVVGWGVGGIEAEAVMLGQPIYMLLPEVVGFKLTGELPEGATATDLVLTVTQMLRSQGVVGKFVEFYGPGLDKMSSPTGRRSPTWLPSTVRRWASSPSMHETLEYLQRTGRDRANESISSRRTTRSRVCSARPIRRNRDSQPRWNSTCRRSSRRWPDRSVRRTASPLSAMKIAVAAGLGNDVRQVGSDDRFDATVDDVRRRTRHRSGCRR